MEIDTSAITTLSDLQAVFDGGILTNDRGNGAAGPQYLPEEDARGLESTEGATPITVVTEQEDPDAWRLAREACDANGCSFSPIVVAVGNRNPGDNGYQQIFCI
jgi:hypothetical protein